jgi:hypothetical protein
LGLTLAFAATSIWGYIAAEQKKSANYDQILLEAESVEDYYEAIGTDPTRVDAYLQFNEFLASDYVLTKEENFERAIAALREAGYGVVG